MKANPLWNEMDCREREREREWLARPESGSGATELWGWKSTWELVPRLFGMCQGPSEGLFPTGRWQSLGFTCCVASKACLRHPVPGEIKNEWITPSLWVRVSGE